MNVLPQIARINTDFFFGITDFAEFTDFRVYKGVASDKSDKSVIYSIQEKSVLFCVICGRIPFKQDMNILPQISQIFTDVLG